MARCPKLMGAKSGRGADALLGGAVADVHVPVVHRHFLATQGRNRVGNDERVMAVGHGRQFFQGREHASGGLAVHHSQQLHMVVAPQFLLYHIRVDCCAQRKLQRVHLSAAASRNVGHATAEETVDGYHRYVTVLQHVAQRGFHASGAGGGQREGHLVGRPEEAAQHVEYVVHTLEENGVEMPQDRLGHRLEHSRIDAARTRPQQNPLRGPELCHEFAHVPSSDFLPGLYWA